EQNIKVGDLRKLSIQALINRDCETNIARTIQTIGATIATADVAEILHVNVGFPILYITRQHEDAKRRPLVFSVARYRGDYYQYVATLEGGLKGRSNPSEAKPHAKMERTRGATSKRRSRDQD